MTFLTLPNCPGGGGGPQSVPSKVLAVWVEETMAGDTPGRECPHEDFGMRPQITTEKMSGGTVSDAYTSGRKTERDWRPPTGVSAKNGGAGSLSGGGGDVGLPGCYWKSPSGGAGWGIPLVDAVNPAGPDGPVVAGGPVGPCEMQSPSFYKSLNPLEHSGPDYAGPDGWHVAIGHMGPFRTLSTSDCQPAGPAGPYVAGGPVGPDASFKVLEPLQHSVLSGPC